MIVRGVTVVLAGLILFESIGRADHLADRLAAKGKPETRLAGVHLTERTRLEDITRLYGKPTRVKVWKSGMQNATDQYEYDWLKRGLKLHVVLERLPKKPGWEYVSLIETSMGTSPRIAKTGRGLRIGQSLNDIKRLYGRRFALRDIPKQNIHDLMLQWRRPEYSLIAELDRHNRIVGLSLAAPE